MINWIMCESINKNDFALHMNESLTQIFWISTTAITAYVHQLLNKKHKYSNKSTK